MCVMENALGLTHLRAHDALRVAGSDGALNGPAEDSLVVQGLNPQEAQEAVQSCRLFCSTPVTHCQGPYLPSGRACSHTLFGPNSFTQKRVYSGI